MSDIKVLRKGVVNDYNQSQFREIQSCIQAVREQMDVIEGNLIDFVDSYTDDSTH